ncbi:MAG: S1 RNA-binding domain-containing protein [Clostridia bacterium]|nr:S1 RNA-binding domain-containing protein [Clostridia bacterium]
MEGLISNNLLKKTMEKENKNVRKKRVVKPKLNIENLKNIKETQQVLDMYIEEVDENLNMIGKVGKDIKAIIPRDEASSVVGDDGLVEEKYIVNKKGKVLPVCIKEIVQNDNQIELIMSKKILELKVRKWMYMHLKPGVKLRGIVVGLKDYAAFVDVGGGVTGILKLQDMSDSILTNSADMFKLGQRIEVIVKKYDRDTGRIELSYKELLGTFEENVKKFNEGDIVEGVVRNRIKTGVFVELMPNIIGIAEHVNGIEYGQKVLVSIKKINLEKKKIKLIIIG